MPTFNLHEHMKRLAVDIPNGQSVSTIPTGNDAGQGMLVSDGGPMGSGGPRKKIPLREIIGDILAAIDDGAKPNEIGKLAKRAVNTEIPPEFSGNDEASMLIIALGRKAFENQDIPTTDPETGRPERGLDDLASAIADEADWDRDQLVMESKQRAETGGTAMPPAPDVATQQLTAAVRRAEEKGIDSIPESVKKKKKANPFKVLMGKVQKLLDHGVDKRNEVIRTIMRQKGNKWKHDTIEQAYSIVKERNVRKERKERKDEPKEDSKSPVRSFNLSHHLSMHRTASDGRFQGQNGGTDVETKRRPSLYDIERPTNSMSFWELLSRLQYLMSASNAEQVLLNENLVSDRPKQGTTTRNQLSQIRAELSDRGYDANMLNRLFGLPLPKQATKPQGKAATPEELNRVKPRQTV